MRILVWHVHGSYATAFVAGGHDYLVPVLPGRGPDGRGRAQTWDWPERVREVTPQALREEPVDLVVLQRPHEAELLRQWTGWRVGRDVPALYLEHDTPRGPAASTEHWTVRDDRLREVPVVHVTHFNALAWDHRGRPTTVVEHGIHDPGPLWTGTDHSLGVVVNEPVRRERIAGTDVVLRLAADVPLRVYGMGTDELGAVAQARGLAGLDRSRCADLPQREMHAALARQRAYLHPYRWTSLGLSLIEAMAMGMPVLALAATAAPEAVPAAAGVVTTDVERLRTAAKRLLADEGEARERGAAARQHALSAFGLERFLADWDRTMKEVVS
ncbi:MAG: glycosyltransferase [Phycicoccus sp.]